MTNTEWIKIMEKPVRDIVKWLNKTYRKPSGKPFTYVEVHKYCDRGFIPNRYGGYKITKRMFRNKLRFSIYE